MTDRRAVGVWVPALHELVKSLKIAEVETWLLPLDPEVNGDAFQLLAPFSIFSAHVEKTYGARIREAVGRDVLIVARHRPCTTDYDGGWRRDFLSEIKAPLNKERYTVKLLPKEEDFVEPSYLEQGLLVETGEGSLSEIIAAVGKVFGVTPEEIVAYGRARRVAVPRHIAVYLSRTHTGASYPQLRRSFGGRNHTSILRSYKSAEELLKNDPALRGRLELARRMLVGAAA